MTSFVVIVKQLLLNSMELPMDMINEIKSFLFYDRITANARKERRGLINDFRRGLTHMEISPEKWGLAFRYERYLVAVNCARCGQYREKKNPSLQCHCVTFYN